MALLAKLAALVPLPRLPLVRSGGCVAPYSHLRGAIIPTPRQQGLGEVIRKILRHLKLAVDPPPMAPARVRHEAFAWSSP